MSDTMDFHDLADDEDVFRDLPEEGQDEDTPDDREAIDAWAEELKIAVQAFDVPVYEPGTPAEEV